MHTNTQIQWKTKAAISQIKLKVKLCQDQKFIHCEPNQQQHFENFFTPYTQSLMATSAQGCCLHAVMPKEQNPLSRHRANYAMQNPN
jgi:hypothetical protein